MAKNSQQYGKEEVKIGADQNFVYQQLQKLGLDALLRQSIDDNNYTAAASEDCIKLLLEKTTLPSIITNILLGGFLAKAAKQDQEVVEYTVSAMYNYCEATTDVNRISPTLIVLKVFILQCSEQSIEFTDGQKQAIVGLGIKYLKSENVVLKECANEIVTNSKQFFGLNQAQKESLLEMSENTLKEIIQLKNEKVEDTDTNFDELSLLHAKQAKQAYANKEIIKALSLCRESISDEKNILKHLTTEDIKSINDSGSFSIYGGVVDALAILYKIINHTNQDQHNLLTTNPVAAQEIQLLKNLFVETKDIFSQIHTMNDFKIDQLIGQLEELEGEAIPG